MCSKLEMVFAFLILNLLNPQILITPPPTSPLLLFPHTICTILSYQSYINLIKYPINQISKNPIPSS